MPLRQQVQIRTRETLIGLFTLGKQLQEEQMQRLLE